MAVHLTRNACFLVVFWQWVIAAFVVSGAYGESPRSTDTVRLIQKCMPSVVDIHSRGEPSESGRSNDNYGGGAVIHPAGFVLTNSHIVQRRPRGEVRFADGKVYPYHLIAQLTREDMALVKVEGKREFQSLPLGRSGDLMLGEPVLTISMHGGFGHSIATGIVSGLNRMTVTPDAYLSLAIQASIHGGPGISGGPLINALGEQIGLVAAYRRDFDAIVLAASIDRVRSLFPRMLAAEDRYGYCLGLVVDMLASNAQVLWVKDGSPAAKAGIRVGDVIQHIDRQPVRHGVDFQLALVERRAGQTMSFGLLRAGEEVTVEAVLAPLILDDPIDAAGLVPGLQYEVYEGRWKSLPDFDQLKPVVTGQIDRPTILASHRGRDGFALRFTGFLRVPSEGPYAFYTRSDDGSQLFVHDRLVVDNDDAHAVVEVNGLTRLRAGFHPIAITYFDGVEAEELEVGVEGPGVAKQTIPAGWFFRR